MRKVWAIAWKELYTTLHDRSLILIMFATPLLLSTILGLAFGGLGSDSPPIGPIAVAVVNLDEGVTLSSLFSGTVDSNPTINNAAITNSDVLTGLPTDFALNTGAIVASILLSEPISTTVALSDSGLAVGNGVACPLVAASSGDNANNTTQGSLDELIRATRLTDATAARQGVEQGEPIQLDYYSTDDPSFPGTVAQVVQSVLTQVNSAVVAVQVGGHFLTSLATLLPLGGVAFTTPEEAIYNAAVHKLEQRPAAVRYVTTGGAEGSTIDGIQASFGQSVPGMGSIHTGADPWRQDLSVLHAGDDPPRS